jgi:hypothetical protein
MAFVTSKPTTRQAPRRRPADSYSTALRLRPPPAWNLYNAPSGTLTGLEDTGIPFLDTAVAGAAGKVDQVAAALRISTVCSVASLGISIVMLARSLRRGG